MSPLSFPDDPDIPTLTRRSNATSHPVTPPWDNPPAGPQSSPAPAGEAPGHPAPAAAVPAAPYRPTPSASDHASASGSAPLSGAVLQALLQAELERAVTRAIDDAVDQVRLRLEQDIPAIVERTLKRARGE